MTNRGAWVVFGSGVLCRGGGNNRIVILADEFQDIKFPSIYDPRNIGNYLYQHGNAARGILIVFKEHLTLHVPLTNYWRSFVSSCLETKSSHKFRFKTFCKDFMLLGKSQYNLVLWLEDSLPRSHVKRRIKMRKKINK